MDAAAALTSLANEETVAITTPVSTADAQSENASSNDQDKPSKKRFIPEHKKADAALTFPEKMFSLMKFADKQDHESFCVAWLPDGKSFVIRNPDGFTRQVLPNYFKATKFSSFTRKLYRWGFRQVNRGIGPDDPIIFGNEFFQRDDAELMKKMRSITAASTRKQEHTTVQLLAQKRALDVLESERDHKRILLDQIMQQKALSMHSQSLFGNQNNGGLNLANALRPSLGNNGGFMGMNGNGGGMKPFDMMSNNALMNMNMNSFQQQLQPNNLPGLPSTNNSFPNAASTADIVNAAINALRFAP